MIVGLVVFKSTQFVDGVFGFPLVDIADCLITELNSTEIINFCSKGIAGAGNFRIGNIESLDVGPCLAVHHMLLKRHDPLKGTQPFAFSNEGTAPFSKML